MGKKVDPSLDQTGYGQENKTFRVNLMNQCSARAESGAFQFENERFCSGQSIEPESEWVSTKNTIGKFKDHFTREWRTTHTFILGQTCLVCERSLCIFVL